jgi:hypothetical protein
MNEIISAMILSLSESANEHAMQAGKGRELNIDNRPDNVWLANMVTAMLLNATAKALSAARDKLR